jgi:hypothetical protein
VLTSADDVLGGGKSRDLPPLGEAGLQELMVFGCGEAVAAGAEVIGDGAEGSQELLRVLGRLKALERPFSPPGGAVRVLGTIVEPLVSAELHAGQHPL